MEPTTQLSVLDRLIDYDPRSQAERQLTWAQSVQVVKTAVQRDLEWLLNTRRVVPPAPDEFSELGRSLYHSVFRTSVP